MRLILTALIFLFGMFDLFMAISFISDPVTAATGFGLQPTGPGGVSTLRADFTAFFGVVAGCMMIGAWRRNADLLLVPVALMGTAFTMRGLNLVLAGPYPGWQLAMSIELAHVVLMVAAWRVLPHHKIEELTS